MFSFKRFLIERVANKGLHFESRVVSHLRKHGLMKKGKKAGFTSGNDFHLINKKTNEVHKGKMHEKIHGEVKTGTHAAYGQLSIHYSEEHQKWHIHPSIREKRPEFAKAVENAHVTVDGKKKKFLDHVTHTIGHPKNEIKQDVYSDHTDLHPAHAYLKDHHVDVLHVGTHGTFRAGKSQHKDATGAGLPKAEGVGRFRVRAKRPGASHVRTVVFNVHKMAKSHLNLEHPEHVEHIKKALGH